MKRGDLVNVVGIQCVLLEVHAGNKVTALLKSDPPQILVGVPKRVEGGVLPTHGTVWDSHQSVDVVKTIEEVDSSADKQADAAKDNALLERLETLEKRLAEAGA